MNPNPEPTSPLTLDKQILALSQQTGRVRSGLLGIRSQLQPNTLEELSQIESRLHKTSQEVTTSLEKYKNLAALADIGQLVNSTLELDEVLRIVMDTIVRLTGAERPIQASAFDRRVGVPLNRPNKHKGRRFDAWAHAGLAARIF